MGNTDQALRGMTLSTKSRTLTLVANQWLSLAAVSGSYGDNFCDGIEELHSTFSAAGAKMIGYVDAGAYTHSESKSDQGGKFLGCPFDEDNESDQSEDRAAAGVEQIQKEGMPL